ncbi:efflux RND transporter periplasmic adaptor subunit [Sinomicrobium sp. M5D2P9]
MKKNTNTTYSTGFLLLLPILLLVVLFTGCKEKEQEDEGLPLPVIELKEESAAKVFRYLGSVEGAEDVDIRPQVDGILEKIYVDEGDYVEKGQPLFKINQQPYMEDLKNAQANVALEKAKLRKAKTELDRLQPLIDNEVISEVQQKTAQADYEVAQSSLDRAQAQAANTRIKLNFTIIEAPVNGFIGRIPKSVGNVVKQTDSEPITVLSNVKEIFVYFSMSESDYLYYERMKKDSTSRRMSNRVKLILADGSTYDLEGNVDAASGQIDRSTGAISLRAKFQNPDTLLRSGNTGKIVMEQIFPKAILIPQSATMSVQDKRFAYTLKDDNTAERHEVEIEGRSGHNYIVKKGTLKAGDRIVVSGINKITDGTKVKPVQQGRLLSDN